MQNQELEEKKNIEDFSQFHWFGKKFYKSVSETHGKHLDLHLIFIKYILKEAEFEEQKHLDAQYQLSNFKKKWNHLNSASLLSWLCLAMDSLIQSLTCIQSHPDVAAQP